MTSPLLALESSRLRLRLFEESDVAAVLAYQSNPDVVRFVPWPVRDEAMVREALRKARGADRFEEEGDTLALAVIRKSDGQLVGQLAAMYRDVTSRRAEFGYVINPAFARQGYALEASTLLLDGLFDEGFERVVAKLDDRNTPSRMLLERLGLRREAHYYRDEFFKGEWTSTYLYAVVREEWRARSRGVQPSTSRVVPLTGADEAAAVALWHASGLTRPWNDPVEDYRRALATSSSVLLGVRWGTQLRGAVMVGDDGHRGWVYYCAVDAAARGRGVGRALMDAAQEWLRARGAVKIQLMVRADNAAVRAFYEHLGFTASDVAVLGRRLDDH